MVRWMIALAVVAALFPGSANAYGHRVRVTYYVDRGQTASGAQTRMGVAACSRNFNFGTRITFPNGMEVTCLDRGDLGRTGWVDVWAPSVSWGRQNVAHQFGNYAIVEVMEP